MRYLSLIVLCTMSLSAYAQVNTMVLERHTNAFAEAHAAFPEIPRGTLQAVAYAQTRMNALEGSEQPGCIGLPTFTGLFALVEDGQGYFRNTLHQVADLSGFPVEELKSSPRIQCVAYAAALAAVLPEAGWDALDIAHRLLALSALPSGNSAQEFARQSELYQTMALLSDVEFMAALNAEPLLSSSLAEIFGGNLGILTASNVAIEGERIISADGDEFFRGGGIAPCYDYAADNFVQTPTCNYSSRAGTSVSAVTVHTIQGTYAGAISWAQNCNSNVSYHYVVRSSDGQVTQMLCESDKGWHVGSENPYTIGIEHEGWINEPEWYTTAMYAGSAALVRDITQSSYGISEFRTSYFPWAATTDYNGTNTPGSCVRIKGHQHFPGQTHTDPGQYWDWSHYYKLLHPNTPVTSLDAASGDYYDTGGIIGVYSNDERTVTLIQPTNGGAVTVTFTQFDVESNWDYLYIYDGATVFSPLIGYYTGTNSPGTVTSTDGALTFEFRSDCSTTAPGWAASWTSAAPDAIAPTVTVSTNVWETENFYALYSENDNAGGSDVNQDERYAQILDFNGAKWRGNPDHGYLFDDFGQALPQWVQQSGTWNLTGGTALQTDETSNNSNLHIPVSQVQFNTYMYGVRMKIGGSGSNRRAGMHFMCSDATLDNRGNSYFVYLRADANKVQIYRVSNDSWTLMTDDDFTVNVNTWYDVKVLCNSFSGQIRVYVNGALASTWADPTPITTGNSISMRSAGCTAEYDDIRVYKSRTAAQYVNIGTVNDPVRYQNPSPSSPACEIRTVIFDNVGNMSGEIVRQVNIDWTPPVLSTLQDGLGPDINETQDGTQLHASWGAAFDTHSGVSHYLAAMGDAPGAVNVADWTNVGSVFSFTAPYSLVPYQWYYAQLKAVNNAGLESTATHSDGQQYVPLTVGIEELFEQSVYPNPTTGQIHLPNANGAMLEVLDATGRRIARIVVTSSVIDLLAMGASEGIYLLRITKVENSWTQRVVLVRP
ncbi:MAG: N-acetylmuramoyl-L-alanine amidase [Flavobacteriales bacterium]|nr:N-acetylmuramoyl-L-alanine amidase [Flavobacteriales bacterium]